MKKLILTTVVYDMPKQTEPVTRQFLVLINSSKFADENHDSEAAVKAAKSWFEKSAAYESGAKYISITAEPTIDADNPEPAANYTEGDLVTFGNFMVDKVYRSMDPGDRHKEPVRVWHSDIANWKEKQPSTEMKKGPSEKELNAFRVVEDAFASSLAPDEYEQWMSVLGTVKTRRHHD